MLNSMRGSPSTNWVRSFIKVGAGNSARRLKEQARLKALHRTPYPMVLSRMKLLLDRLQVRIAFKFNVWLNDLDSYYFKQMMLFTQGALSGVMFKADG